MFRLNLKGVRFSVIGGRLALVLILGAATVAMPIAVQGQGRSDDPRAEEANKAYWQNRYRSLRDDAESLRKEIITTRTAYAAANRRNYRRGTNRKENRALMLDAEQKLKEVEKELAGLSEEARVQGALPGWLREVEDEPVGAPAPASDPEYEWEQDFDDDELY